MITIGLKGGGGGYYYEPVSKRQSMKRKYTDALVSKTSVHNSQ